MLTPEEAQGKGSILLEENLDGGPVVGVLPLGVQGVAPQGDRGPHGHAAGTALCVPVDPPSKPSFQRRKTRPSKVKQVGTCQSSEELRRWRV